ncbi:rhombosortase [Vibrio navarrensis]|uniref:Rhombosortase n=1 Tax=Vibrio navarrensis TaxID=29495 RepID=A0AAI9CVR8_9VIBR|nr:rhombosortase [Vibrio navarrensis]EJL6394384.1 rhombosortase [Vibrio navarrensis]EKA5636457.1 rhombosortase [Vibrio navarrensis]ELN6933129.1 rhombosortase [Vibrio navarrensis]
MLKNDKFGIRWQCTNPLTQTGFFRFTTSGTITGHRVNLFIFLSIISAVCLALQYPALSELAEWNKLAIEQGQWWRILTGNFTHTNFAHLAMNLAGLWVICYLFKPRWASVAWLLGLVSLLVGVANLSTSMSSYVGLSGTLHGLFAYYALTEYLHGRKSSGLLVVGVIGKVWWEHSFGASISTSELIAARVAIEAHLFGMLSGLVFALICLAIDKKRQV